MIKPISNYKILPEGFKQGPFKDFGELEEEYLAVQEKGRGFLGNFVLLSSGELKKGIQKGLHTFVAELDAESSRNIHIHYGKDMGSMFILGKYKGKVVTEHYPVSEKDQQPPIYTLEGFYDTLSNQEVGTRLKALKHEFNEQGLQERLLNFNNSLAKRNETQLKLLENLYKREISDQ